MSSHRPTISLRATSSSTNTSSRTSTTTTPSTNPGSPFTPFTPSSSKETTSFPFFSSSRQPRSQTIDSFSSRFHSRTKSPGPVQDAKDLPPSSASHLKHAATSPVDRHSQTQHHSRRSQGSVPSTLPTSPADAAFFQKKRQSSSGYGQCGRHGNEWLFGGVSISETVKHAVKRKDKSCRKENIMNDSVNTR